MAKDKIEITYNRDKKPIAYIEEAKLKAKYISEDFIDYIGGVRTIYLIHRNKEGGGSNHNRRQIKAITQSPKEFRERLEEYVHTQLTADVPFRIYSSVNERDMTKAIRQFKFEQLNADYYGEIEKNDFYFDVKNRFHGCLMTPASRKTSLFMVDCDSIPAFHESLMKLAELGVTILKQYPTKNGWHIITEPFNPTLFEVKDAEIHKDGLLLLSF